MSQSSTEKEANLSRVFSPTFLTVTKKQDLLKNLVDLHAVLGTITQDRLDRPRGLQLIANQIVSTRIVNHGDNDIRLLATCCAVDILRIYAPDAPYQNEELLRIFKVVVQQLRQLASIDTSTGSGTKVFYILMSLSIVKSCVVMVALHKNGLPGADELLTDLFDALIGSIRSDHPPEVGMHMGSVLQACLEEMESFETEIMERLLLPLLPANKTAYPAAFALCQSVLRRTASHLSIPLSNILNQHLMAWNENDTVVNTHLYENIYALVYEMHKISPNLLLRVLPNLCMQLLAEDEEVRLKAVKVLGRLFASPHAEYGVQFHKNYREYLNRMGDISIPIRMEMVMSGAITIRKKPALRELTEESLLKKLRDVDSDVRLETTTQLLEAAHEDPLCLSPAAFVEIAERMKDKKPEIRKLSMTGLCRVYAHHLCPDFPSLSHSALDLSMSKDTMDRLRFLPKYILNCWGYPDAATRLLVLELLHECLLPMSSHTESSSAEDTDDTLSKRRAAALLTLFQDLSSVERSTLGTILSFQSRVRIELAKFLLRRSEYQNTKTSDAAEVVKSALYCLMTILPPLDKKTLIYDKIMAVKDKHVFRLMAFANDPASSISSLIEARDDMKSRLDSKSALGEYFTMVFNVACFGVCNAGSVRGLLNYASYCSEKDEEDGAGAEEASELLMTLSKHASPVFQGSAVDFESWLTACAGGVSGKALKNCLSVVKSAASALVTGGKSAGTDLCNTLLRHSMKASSQLQCEAFAEAAGAVARAGVEGPVESAIKSLSSDKRLTTTNKRLALDLFILAELITNCPRTLTRVASTQHLLEVIKSSVLTSSEQDISVQVLGAGMKVWTSLCIASTSSNNHEDARDPLELDEANKENVNEEPEGVSQLSDDLVELMHVLFECIVSKGTIFFGFEFDEEENQLFLRETAAICIFQLLRLKEVGKSLTVTQWHAVGWSLLDPHPGCRRNLMNMLSNLIQTTAVHPRILALPCLLATDDALSVPAEHALMFAVRRLRKTHQALCDRALNSHDARTRKIAEDNMPETMLPYALHLLSHHPDFPTSSTIDDEHDKRRMKAVMKSLTVVLNVLLDSAYAVGDNLSYLFKQVTMITRFYTDKIDEGNLGLNFVTRLTRKLLNDKIRSAENVQSYPGDISLPMDLYALCSEEEEEEGGVAVECAVDEALSKVGMMSKGASKTRHETTKIRSPRKAVAAKLKAAKKPVIEKPAKKSSTKRAKSVVNREDEGHDDEAEEDEMLMPAVSAAPSVRPTRSGRATKAVRYTEVEETEREVERWNEEAGRSAEQRKSSGSVRGNNSQQSADSTEQENIFEYKSPVKTSKKKIFDVLDEDSPDPAGKGDTKKKTKRGLANLSNNKRQRNTETNY